MKLFSGFKRKEVVNLSLFGISLIPVILYLFVASQRIGLPFDLEWGEGAGINQIHRLLSGEKLYVPPTLEFAPLVYTPFYYWLASILSRFNQQQVILAARLLSLLASLASAAIIIWLVAKDTRRFLAGWLAGALYLGCFAFSDGFYDLVRVDSLYIFMLLLSLAVLRIGLKPIPMLAAGLSIAVGFYTKQSTLIVFAPLLIFLWITNWKKAWPLLPVILLGVILPLYWINLRSGGWFVYYIFQLPREHGYSLVSAVYFWVGDVLGPLGISVGFGLLFVFSHYLGKESHASGLGREHPDASPGPAGRLAKRLGTYYVLFAVGAFGAAWVTRASNGGGANNAMTAYAALAILFGLGYHEAQVWAKKQDAMGGLGEIFVSCLVAIQMLGLIYNPFHFLPTAGEIKANEMLVAEMRAVEEPPWMPFRSHYPRRAAKQTSIHAVNLFELTGFFKGEVLPEGRELVNEIRENVCNQAYGMVVLDQPVLWISDQLSAAYQLDDRFSFLESERRSKLLEWQGGYEAFYLPREDYDPSSCLATIDYEGTK